MIKFIKTYFREKAEANRIQRQEAKAKAKAKAAQKKRAFVNEIKALRLIAINNARYIRASINVLNGTVNHAKGSSAAETKRKREFLRKRLAWLQRNQGEEEGMIIHYDSLLEKV